MIHSPRILITGATGAVGPLVVKAFHTAGYAIRTLSMDPPPAGIWPDNIETRLGDITDTSAVQTAMQGVDSVIHMAALLHIVDPPPEMRDKYEKINVGGTATIVDAAIDAGVRRVVLFSTIAVYGQSNGRIITEDTPPQPNTFYARTKRDAEEILLAAKRANGEGLGTVLRLGAVYGPRIKGNYQRLVQSLARGRFVPLGNGSNRRTLVYDKDVAHAAVLAATHPMAAGNVFNVSDGCFHSMNDIIGTICDALGRRSPSFALPVRPVRFAAGLLEESLKLFGRSSPVTRDTIDKYTEDTAVDSQLIQAVLGFAPQYDLMSGWKETIQEMRRAGDL
jgi:nucleoside-diphosphate-sugar epimerase